MTAARIIVAACGAIVLAACGDGDGTRDMGADTTTTAEATTAAAPPPRETQREKPPPRTWLGDNPIPAGELQYAYFYWYDETVTVAGYPALATSSARWQSAVNVGAAPETKAAALLRCEMRDTPQGRLTVDTALTLRGRVSRRMFAVPDGDPPKVVLDECRLDRHPDPMAVATLHEEMFGWQGATVRVVGHFSGTTTSTPGFDESRTVTSHALAASAGGVKLVECNHRGAQTAPEAVVQRRDGTVVVGTIAEPNGDVVVLDNCYFEE